MSADPTKFPAGPKPVAGQMPKPPVSEEAIGRATGIPDDLRSISRPERLSGAVIKTARDAATQEIIVRVRTARGDIDVRLPKDQPAPKEGQPVEIEIRPAVSSAPGQTPEQAVIIRPAPREAAPTAASPEQQPARPVKTPVEVEIRPIPVEQPAAELRPPPLSGEDLQPWPQPGDFIRLQPLAPKEAALLQDGLPLESFVNTTVQNIDFKARIIAADTEEKILTQTLNISTEQIETPLKFSLAASAPVAIPTPGLPPEQILTPVTPETLLPVKAALLQTPFAMQPILVAAGTETPARPIPLDGRIETIGEPQPLLIAPGQKQHQIPALLSILKESTPLLQNQSATAMTGVITATTPENLPVLSVFLPSTSQTPTNFVLQAPAEMLLPGTLVQFTPQNTATPQMMTQILPPLAALLTPEPWPLMEEIYQTLAQIAPQAAQAMARMIPAPANAAQITPAALFFIAAVRGGDMTGWLGDKTIDILRREGRGGLISRLTQEAGQIGRLGAEPISQDWRAVSLPMFFQGEIYKMALYYKQDGQGRDEDGKKGGQTRFIFDLSLSEMGKVQIDGLFRGGRLDLILRTEQAFSQAMQMDMRRTYAKAIGQAELGGELSFQNHPDQWVTIKAAQQGFGTSA